MGNGVFVEFDRHCDEAGFRIPQVRSLIARVTLPPSREGSKIELQGRLAPLTGARNLYPEGIGGSGGALLSISRYDGISMLRKHSPTYRNFQAT
jgi:hypothetical protein